MAETPLYTGSYALVVGINSYTDPRFVPLGKAEDDAAAFANFLESPAYGFHVTRLLGVQATRKAVLEALYNLRRGSASDRILVYFAGHGYTLSDRYGSETGYLAAADTVPEQDFTALEMDEVTSLIRYASARHIAFIFDACFSGQALGLTRAPSIAAEKFLERRAYQIISAGAGDQTVSDYQSMTAQMLEGLREGVANEDGMVTFSEIGLYLQQTIAAESGKTQIPQFGHLRGSQGGDLIFSLREGSPAMAAIKEARTISDSAAAKAGTPAAPPPSWWRRAPLWAWGIVAASALALIGLLIGGPLGGGGKNPTHTPTTRPTLIAEVSATPTVTPMPTDTPTPTATETPIVPTEPPPATATNTPIPAPLEISFISNRDSDTRTIFAEIYVALLDGTLIGNPLIASAWGSMDWSPDGSRIVFTSWKGGSQELYIANADGSSPRALTRTSRVAEEHPRWSPDGAAILYSSNQEGSGDLYVIPVQGGVSIRRTFSSGNDLDPAWSPDGTRIAYQSDDDIWVMTASGRNAHVVFASPASDTWPSWSPDGSKIAFATGDDGDFEICVIDAEGKGDVTCLTDNFWQDVQPAWSPDGSQIAYASDRNGSLDIWVMNADGTDQRRLTVYARDDWAPAWRPVP